MAAGIEADYADFEKKLEDLRLKTLLTGKYDHCGAILSVHAGAGGVDAMDWASIFASECTHTLVRKRRATSVEDTRPAGLMPRPGIKSATLLVEARTPTAILKNEKGVHRLVRISPFNAAENVRTSFALIEVRAPGAG